MNLNPLFSWQTVGLCFEKNSKPGILILVIRPPTFRDKMEMFEFNLAAIGAGKFLFMSCSGSSEGTPWLAYALSVIICS